MRSRAFRNWVLVAAVPAMVLSIATPVAAGAASARTSAVRPAARRAVERAGARERVIVVLRQQNRVLAGRPAAAAAAAALSQRPVVAQLRSSGATGIVTTSVLNSVIATVSSQEAAVLAGEPAVASVVPAGVEQVEAPQPASLPLAVPRPGATAHGARAARTAAAAAPCGTSAHPELDPEALTNIDAVQAQALGADGAGVTVAFLADGINPADPDFRRNASFASKGSPAGAPVIARYLDFSGDGTNAPTPGGEAFLDAGSIAAQGNATYDLSQFVTPKHPLPKGCDIRIVGVAPGADLLALKVFGETSVTSPSDVVQAVNYAVLHGARVINESFGIYNFPDTASDVIRQADEAAVAAGVTVVVSSGDAGPASTIGSPASDPGVITVGATTTFRAYAQVTNGGINDPHGSGAYVDDNVSAMSSGGFSQGGGAVDLVAPGDLNWTDCDASRMYSDCVNESNAPSPIQLGGGTSEAAAITSGAAADVIGAYAKTHDGSFPSPALVKQILMSTATDVEAPAVEQGAGMLDVERAVTEAESIAPTTAAPAAGGGLLVGPGEINVVQNPGATSVEPITLTNTGSSPLHVAIATRELATRSVSSGSGSFCMQPGKPTKSCPADTGTFPIWSGVTEVYKDETFSVPATATPSRLELSAACPLSNQTSAVHIALFEPDGTYAGYSVPQGVSGYGEVEVTDPSPGVWTAVFFTERNGAVPHGRGTSGTVRWNASVFEYQQAAPVGPGSVTIGAGDKAIVDLTLTSPAASGDTDQSVTLATPQGTTTIPVTVRTAVPLNRQGGKFNGVLTGGNGRTDAPGDTAAYVLDVPRGEKDMSVRVGLGLALADVGLVGASLVDPSGETLASTSNLSFLPASRWLDLYQVAPRAGRWTLVLDELESSGRDIYEPFVGVIAFGGVNEVHVHAGLPDSARTRLERGKHYRFKVSVKNTGRAPAEYFLDPRLDTRVSIGLQDEFPGGGFKLPGLFLVPPFTTAVHASLEASVPATFDLKYTGGDPDLSPAVSPSGFTHGGRSAKLVLTAPEVSPGLWLVYPDAIGHKPAGGSRGGRATVKLGAVTRAFDPAVTSSAGDLWRGGGAAALLLGAGGGTGAAPGRWAHVTVDITPRAAKGRTVSGTIFVEAAGPAVSGALPLLAPLTEVLAAIPYRYKVG